MNILIFAEIILVALGAIFMATSIMAGHRTTKKVPPQFTTKWLILSILMVFFFIGYIIFIFVQLYDIQFPLQFFVSIIFFAGGFFVYLTINLSKDTISKLDSNAQELREINKNLDELVRQRTDELKKSNTELNQIFNTVTDGMRIINLDMEIIQANKTFEKLTGLPAEKIIGRKCHEIFPGTACGTPDCPWELVKKGNTRIESEVEKKRPDDTLISCIVTATSHRTPAGELIGVIETYKDISQRKKMEEQLMASLDTSQQLANDLKKQQIELSVKNQEIEKAYEELKMAQSHILQQEKMASIGQLAAGVAHEINNPMGFISSNLGTLEKYMNKLAEFIKIQSEALINLKTEAQVKVNEARKKLKLDFILEDTKDLISESQDGAKRVSEIVQNLKTFSRVDEANVKASDIHECLDSTIKVIWNEIKYKAELIREYGEIPLVICNPQEITQVFMNIIINAAHAIEEHGEIRIKTRHEADHVAIEISDTGRGIPPEIISRLFEPFFTTKDVGQGTGLGLSIAHEIIQKYNGEIEIESELGKGSIFKIILPVSQNT